MKLHLPKGLRQAVLACLALYASHAAYAEEHTLPNGLSGGFESQMTAVTGYDDGGQYTGSMYTGIEVSAEELDPGVYIDSVYAESTEVVLTDAIEDPESIAKHGTMWNRFGGYLAGSNISSEIGSSSLIIRDIADSVSISGWNVGGSAQINTGTHLPLNDSYGVPTFNNVGTTSVSIEATKGSNFYVFGVDGVILQDNRNTWQEVYNRYVYPCSGSTSAGPISIVGGNLMTTWMTIAGLHSMQSIISESSNVTIGGGIITGHVVGGSALFSLHTALPFPDYDESVKNAQPGTEAQIPSKENFESFASLVNGHNALELWVNESHVTMTGGKMEKGWAHGQNGSQVSNYYYYDEKGDIMKDEEGEPILKPGITDSMVPRIIGGNLLHVADIARSPYGGTILDTYQKPDGWIENAPAFGIGNTHVTISGNSEVYDVVGGSWSLIDIPDMLTGAVDIQAMMKDIQERTQDNPDVTTDQIYEEIVSQFNEKLPRDVHQGNTHVTLKDQVIVKGDVIAAGIQSGRTALITESTKISIGSNVKFAKDLTKYDSTQDKIVPVENMWEINGTHSIVDGGYMLTDPPVGDTLFNPLESGPFVSWDRPAPPPPPVYSLDYSENDEAEATTHRKEANAEYDMDAIEKKGYWNLGEFEKGGFGWNDADYSVYSDHPYVHGDRTLELGDAAEYDASLRDAYFINFDQVNIVKGGKATIGSLVIDDNQTFADQGTAPTSEKWSSKRYENDVPMEYRERNLTTISGGGEIRMWVGFDMEVWYWESKDFENTYKEYTEEELREMENGSTLNSDIGRKKYLSAVYDPEVLNNTYIGVKGYDDAQMAKAERNEHGELVKGTTLHLLPRENTVAPAASLSEDFAHIPNAVSYAYRMEAYNGGVLHVDVAPTEGRNTMYVLNELNIHDEGYLKMSVNITEDMEWQERAAIHKAPKDTKGSAPGSVRELMSNWDSMQTVTFNNGYFDLRIKGVHESLYKDELYIVLIDRVTGNNVGIGEGQTKNYTITNRTKEVLDYWFGDAYDYEKELTDTAEWNKHHVWIGVEKVTDGREGNNVLEEDRKDADDWAMVIRAKKEVYDPTPLPPVLEPIVPPEEPEEPEEPEPPTPTPDITYHRRHANTPNGLSGGELMDEFANNPTEDEFDVRKLADEYIIDLNADDRYAESDRVQAAIAGSSLSALGMAVVGDSRRQLRLMRNRGAKSLSQELMRIRQKTIDGGKAGISVHEYPEPVPSKRYGFWISGESEFSSMKEVSTDPGYRLSSWGGSVGGSAVITSDVEVGLAITAMYGDFKSKGPDLASGDLDTTYLSAFARLDSGRWSHLFIGSIGLVKTSGTRTVSLGEYGCYGTHYDTDGYALGLMYEGSYTFYTNRNKTGIYQAVFNISWNHAHLNGFTETGDTAGNLRVGDQDLDEIVLGGGFRGQWLLSGDMMNRGSILELRTLAKGYINARRNRVSVGFADRDFSTKVRSHKRGAFGLEVGASYTLPLNSELSEYDHSIFFDVNAELRSDCTEFNATIGYKFTF